MLGNDKLFESLLTKSNNVKITKHRAHTHIQRALGRRRIFFAMTTVWKFSDEVHVIISVFAVFHFAIIFPSLSSHSFIHSLTHSVCFMLFRSILCTNVGAKIHVICAGKVHALKWQRNEYCLHWRRSDVQNILLVLLLIFFSSSPLPFYISCVFRSISMNEWLKCF